MRNEPLIQQALNSVNDPSAGSPTKTLLRLLLPLGNRVRPPFDAAKGVSKRLARPPESVVATGGVNKGQVRIRRTLVPCNYEAFRVRVVNEGDTATVPTEAEIGRLGPPLTATLALISPL